MTDVFEDTTKGTTTTTVDDNASNSNGAENLVEQLVGQGKKFATVEDLAKGKTEADKFITQLQAENKQLRETTLNKSEVDERFNDVLKRIDEQAQSKAQGKETTSTVGATEIAAIVRSQLTQAEQERTATQNVSIANDKILAQYGDKAGEFLESKAKELNLSKQDLKLISAKSPSAFLSLVGVEKPAATVTVTATKGSVNTESNFNQDTKVGTWEYFQDLRRKNPTEYFSPKVQNEIFKRTADGTLKLPN